MPKRERIKIRLVALPESNNFQTPLWGYLHLRETQSFQLFTDLKLGLSKIPITFRKVTSTVSVFTESFGWFRGSLLKEIWIWFLYIKSDGNHHFYREPNWETTPFWHFFSSFWLLAILFSQVLGTKPNFLELHLQSEQSSIQPKLVLLHRGLLIIPHDIMGL